MSSQVQGMLGSRAGLSFLDIQGLQDPSVDEFLAHPDFRQIAAFFLGWVFMCSIGYILYSSIVQRFLHRLFFRLFPASTHITDPEVASPISEKSPSTWTASLHGSPALNKSDNHTLVFTLCLCFAFASVAHFSSLLTFDPNGGAAACAFVVAWGGMAAQSGRLIGLLILSFELRQLGISLWESIIFWIWLGIGIVFVFVTNAISIGTTKVVQQLGVSLCYRRHFLPTSLVSSLIYLLLDIYVVIRLSILIAPTFLQLRHRVTVMGDLRVIRGLSLVTLELLTIVPAVIFTGIVGEFVPFSIGALIVLAAFNHHTADSIELRMTSIPPSTNGSLPSRRSTAPTIHSLILPTGNQVPRSPYRPQSMADHPFGAKSISHTVDHWESQPKSARSSRTIDSVTAKSIQTAVIQVAARGSRAPVARPADIVPPMPTIQYEPPSTRTFEGDLGQNVMPLQPRTSRAPRQIWPGQSQFVDQSGDGSPRTPRPTILINTNNPALRSKSSADPVTSRTPRSPTSIIYGSDIIRPSGRDHPRRVSQLRGVNDSAQNSLYPTSPRETLLSSPSRSARSTRRFSLASIMPPNEEMPSLYEINQTSNTDAIPRPRVLTFGQDAFHDAPRVASPPPVLPSTRGLPSRPLVGTSGPRTSGIRGPRPRPGPSSPFGPDDRFLTPAITDDMRGRRRSGSLNY